MKISEIWKNATGISLFIVFFVHYNENVTENHKKRR